MVNESYSVYPQQLDGYASLPIRRNAVHEIRAEDHNRLRDAIIKIEQELGVQPSAQYATVSDRLDNIGDARNIIDAHIADLIAVHTAAAITVADTEDLFYYSTVETVLNELGLVLARKPDTIGNNVDWIPNTGVPSFYDGYGTKFVYNISDWSGEAVDNEVVRTSTRLINGIRGIHILEVSAASNNGRGVLTYDQSNYTLRWQAPQDTPGTAVDISGLATGETAIIRSNDTTQALRVARTSDTLPTGAREELFEIYELDAVSGIFTTPDGGFKETSYITRTAISSTEPSRRQFVISGMVYPANTGTLVLQRKRRNDDTFFPIAVLDLGANFDGDLRETQQPAYIPTLSNYDVITLFDRVPALRDYAATQNADGEEIWEDFPNDYYHTQIARYTIPVSNSVITAGELLSANETRNEFGELDQGQINLAASAYRIVHYKAGVTNFNGLPAAADIHSLGDVFGELGHDGNSTVRISNLFVDYNDTRPGVEDIHVTPPQPQESLSFDGATNTYYSTTERVKFLSGIKYYTEPLNSTENRFGFRILSDGNLAATTYVREKILEFDSSVFNFPSGFGADGYSSYGAQVDLGELQPDPDAYSARFDIPNMPEYDSKGWYVVNSTVNADRKLTLPPNKFSAKAFISARFYDPFGPGDGYDGYGDADFSIFDRSYSVVKTTIGFVKNRTRVLVNTYTDQSTDTQEYFTDENYRVGYERIVANTARAYPNYEEFDFPTNEGKFTHTSGVHIIGGSGSDGYVLTEWNNEVPIGPQSLQCGARWTDTEFNVCGLIYPQSDYSRGDIMPFQFDESVVYDGEGINITYTAPGEFSASYDGYGSGSYKVYQRLFSLGYPISNARLRVTSGGDNPVDFSDIAYYNTNRFAKIEVKIPGNDGYSNTEWLDIGRLFDNGRYEAADGALNGNPSGSAGNFIVPFTFGRRNNADAGNMVAVRVTYFSTNDHGTVVLDHPTYCPKKRIITMLELLPPISSE